MSAFGGAFLGSIIGMVVIFLIAAIINNRN